MATTTGETRRGTRKKSGAASMAMRALRGARDVYVRGLRGLDRLVAAANPRAGVGRPTSRVLGVGGDRGSEEDLRDLVRAMQARRAAASAGAARSRKTEVRASAVRREGGMMLESINEDTAPVHTDYCERASWMPLPSTEAS